MPLVLKTVLSAPLTLSGVLFIFINFKNILLNIKFNKNIELKIMFPSKKNVECRRKMLRGAKRAMVSQRIHLTHNPQKI